MEAIAKTRQTFLLLLQLFVLGPVLFETGGKFWLSILRALRRETKKKALGPITSMNILRLMEKRMIMSCKSAP